MSTPAGIARSLTTRINRKKSVTDGAGGNGGLSRAFSMKRQERPAPRPEISLPIELVSATNPLAFNAPDLPQNNSVSPAFSPTQKQLNAVASSNSLRSDGSVPALSSATSATFTFSGVSTPTEEVPETPILDLHSRLASSTETSVETPSSPKSDRSFSSNKARSPLSEEAAPAVPKRAPSHTKRTHQALARQRSQSRIRSNEGQDTSEDSRKSSSSSAASQHLSAGSGKDALVARTSADMFSAHNHNTSIDSNHPFGAELAKLTEVAEQFSPRRTKAEGLSLPRDRSVSSARTNVQPPTPKTPVPKKMIRKQRPAIEPTVCDEELEYLSKHGLRTFSAEEYMAEIGSPYMSSFPGSPY